MLVYLCSATPNTALGLHAASAFGMLASLSARLTNPESELPKREEPAKRYESSTTKNKKKTISQQKEKDRCLQSVAGH